MLDIPKNQKILKKILNSSEFKESKRYQELLEYLAKASESKKYIKETTIAADLFSKDSSFDPHDDPTIRAYISNLRKKLYHYYLTEGKDDQIRLEIPKGHYYVEFVQASDLQKRSKINHKYLTYFLFIPVVIILFSIILIQRNRLVSTNKYNTLSKDHIIWGEFLQRNDNPTLVVLGDYFFLYNNKKNVEGGYFVRDPEINSREEFKQLLIKNPRIIENFVECNFTYLGPSTAESISYILPILLQAPNKIFLKYSSELEWEDLMKYNVIFVGTLKTLYELNKLLPRFLFKYQIIPPQLFLLDENADTVKTFRAMPTERTSYKNDIGVIVKHLGPKNNIIILFTGFDELGVIESVRISTNQNFTSQIKAEYFNENIPQTYYFMSIIEVEGVDRMSFKSEIKHFQSLNLTSE